MPDTTPEQNTPGHTAWTWRDVYPGEWRHLHGYIWSGSLRDGEATPCQVRGWGYLTGFGHGALGLSDVDAVRIQNEVGALISAAPDLVEALKGLLENLTEGDFISETRIDAARAALSKAGASE